MNFWPADPATTRVSTTGPLGVALVLQAPWPVDVSDYGQISVLQDVFVPNFLSTTPTTGLGLSTTLPFNLA